MNKEKLHEIVGAHLADNILKGTYGVSGARFFTTRELAKLFGCSLTTAQKTLDALKQRRLLTLIGHKYYLTYGRATVNSDFAADYVQKKIIGFHIKDTKNSFFTSFIGGVEDSAYQNGYQIIVAGSANSWNKELDILDMFLSMNVAGIISCPGQGAFLNDAYCYYPIPALFLSHALKHSPLSRVRVDEHYAALNIVKHVLNQGYEDFYYISGRDLKSNIEDNRYAGYKDGLAQSGIELDDGKFIFFDNNSYEFKKLLYDIIKKIERPTAFLCYHDNISLRVLEICAQLSRKVPDDVGIFGFDNLPFTHITEPSLSTIDYKTNTMAHIAVKQLISEIEHNAPAIRELVAPTLLIRASTNRKKEPTK